MGGPSATKKSSGTAALPVGREVRLSDRYALPEGPVVLTGIQAVVRMVFDQLRADVAAKRNTAGFVSGYQGSPLGGLDQEFARQHAIADELDLKLQPAVNEELAATAVWGTQLLDSVGRARVDGVLGVWYGKSPGVDRATDALRHGNFVGAHPRGGMLLLAGDDPQCKSSSIAGASESVLASLGIPVLFPGNPSEILDMGRHAVTLSRHSGLWAALKIVTDVADGFSVVDLHPFPTDVVLPDVEHDGKSYVHAPSGALVPPASNEMEATLWGPRMELARAYIQANRLDRVHNEDLAASLGIVAAGSTYYELQECLRAFGLSSDDLAPLGIRILKPTVIWPVDAASVRRFARGLETILVLEDKGPLLEPAIRDCLYRTADTPLVIGKLDREGAPLLPRAGVLDQAAIGAAVGRELLRIKDLPHVRERLDELTAPRPATPPLPLRTPVFCSGCPHNRSTDVPEGAVVGGGIGCHSIVMITPAGKGAITANTQMGGEGAQWIGQAPFVDTPHLFQNMGDGTFGHSGALAVRAAIAADVNITFKLLFNSAVAMTGGQTVQGGMDTERLTWWLQAEGVRRVIITTDDPARYRGVELAPIADVRDRTELNTAQVELRKVAGVTVLIHDQACAAELRRKRKRGQAPDPPHRILINERVCEGCGDCGRKSHCVAVEPVRSEFGEKTQINQSSCNKDYSCLEGDCPSFLTVIPGKRTQRSAPKPPTLEPPRRVVREAQIRLIGIGGTGVVTVSQILAMAAVLDGKHSQGVDQTGLAQKGGQVISDIRIAPDSSADDQRSPRIAAGRCDLYLALDPIGGATPTNLAAIDPEHTQAVISSSEVPVGSAIGDLEESRAGHQGVKRAVKLIQHRAGAHPTVAFDGIALAERLFGTQAPANSLMLGAAWQLGCVPLSLDALESAFRLNGVAVDTNIAAFHWGRAAATTHGAVTPYLSASPEEETSERAIALVQAASLPVDQELRSLLEIRVADLIGYQSERYAKRYLDLVVGAAAQEVELTSGSTRASRAFARQLHRLLAYKDEYEVARLQLRPQFVATVRQQFGEDATVRYMLHPPLLRALGLKHKLALGSWFRPILRILRAGRALRGTPLDPFRWTTVRRIERSLIEEYQTLVSEALPHIARTPETVHEICELPDVIRGYEHVKLANVADYRARAAQLKRRLSLAEGSE
jgi:indolepyruvate ferredoxin oxidoreductase